MKRIKLIKLRFYLMIMKFIVILRNNFYATFKIHTTRHSDFGKFMR